MIKQIKSVLGIGSIIRGRISSYGVVIDFANPNKLRGRNPVNFGISMFSSLGFPLYKKALHPFMKHSHYFEDDQFSAFMDSLLEIESLKINAHTKECLSTRDLETYIMFRI